MVPFWGRSATHFSLCLWGLGCSLGVRGVEPPGVVPLSGESMHARGVLLVWSSDSSEANTCFGAFQVATYSHAPWIPVTYISRQPFLLVLGWQALEVSCKTSLKWNHYKGCASGMLPEDDQHSSALVCLVVGFPGQLCFYLFWWFLWFSSWVAVCNRFLRLF